MACSGSNGADVGAEDSAQTGKKPTGAKAERLLAAFGEANAVDNAMGGRFGVEASDVQCAFHGNTALDEAAPLFGVATHGCKMTIADRTPAEVSADDPEPKAEALLDALEKAGAVADSAMGKT